MPPPYGLVHTQLEARLSTLSFSIPHPVRVLTCLAIGTNKSRMYVYVLNWNIRNRYCSMKFYIELIAQVQFGGISRALERTSNL